MYTSVWYCYFNPRLREGGDGIAITRQYDKDDFNPRLREGGDEAVETSENTETISIHASVKEATATYCDTSAIMYISSLNNFFVHYF